MTESTPEPAPKPANPLLDRDCDIAIARRWLMFRLVGVTFDDAGEPSFALIDCFATVASAFRYCQFRYGWRGLEMEDDLLLGLVVTRNQTPVALIRPQRVRKA